MSCPYGAESLLKSWLISQNFTTAASAGIIFKRPKQITVDWWIRRWTKFREYHIVISYVFHCASPFADTNLPCQKRFGDPEKAVQIFRYLDPDGGGRTCEWVVALPVSLSLSLSLFIYIYIYICMDLYNIHTI